MSHSRPSRVATVRSVSSPRILAVLLVVASVAAGAFGSGVAAAGSSGSSIEEARKNFRAYALIRQNLLGCSLDRTWRHMGSVQRRRCVRLRRLYTLWSEPGESTRYHIHCKTRRCPPRPIGAPDPRKPIPRGADVFR